MPAKIAKQEFDEGVLSMTNQALHGAARALANRKMCAAFTKDCKAMMDFSQKPTYVLAPDPVDSLKLRFECEERYLLWVGARKAKKHGRWYF